MAAIPAIIVIVSSINKAKASKAKQSQRGEAKQSKEAKANEWVSKSKLKAKKGDVLTGIAHLYQRSDYIYEYACDRMCVCVCAAFYAIIDLAICISFSMINSISFNCIDKLLVF